MQNLSQLVAGVTESMERMADSVENKFVHHQRELNEVLAERGAKDVRDGSPRKRRRLDTILTCHADTRPKAKGTGV